MNSYTDKKPDLKLVFLGAMFVALFVLANILAVKKIDIGPFVLTAGLLAFPFTFLITDAVNEVYGKRIAKKLVIHGFIIMAVVVGLIQIAIKLPPADFWVGEQEAFALVLSGTLRITLASMAAYLMSQLYDVWMFDYIKNKTQGKHLWLRNNVSTITAQIIDSSIFITIAFWGMVPNEALFPMIAGQWVAKWVIALLDTPFCYLLVNWARKVKVEHGV